MITIRPIELTDVDELYAEIDRSRAALSVLTWTATVTRDEVLDYLKAKTSPNPKGNPSSFYVVLLDDKIVGQISIDDSAPHLGHRLSYWIGANYRGRGYMKDAVQQVMKLHFDEKQFYALVTEDNAASLWLLWGLGFKEDERFKRELSGPIWVKLLFTRHLA